MTNRRRLQERRMKRRHQNLLKESDLVCQKKLHAPNFSSYFENEKFVNNKGRHYWGFRSLKLRIFRISLLCDDFIFRNIVKTQQFLWKGFGYFLLTIWHPPPSCNLMLILYITSTNNQIEILHVLNSIAQNENNHLQHFDDIVKYLV